MHFSNIIHYESSQFEKALYIFRIELLFNKSQKVN